MARTIALIAPVCSVLLRVSCSSEMVPNGPKREEMHQKMCLGSNSVDQEGSLWKILKRHRGMNFALIAPVCPVLLPVSWSTETVPNAPKREETHQNMSLWSSGMDQERSLWKILTGHRGINFCINCTSLARLHRVSCSNEMIPNAPKHYETH